MIRTPWFVAAAALLVTSAVGVSDQRPATAAAASGITAREIDGHLRFLSHDLLVGYGSVVP